MRKINSNNPKRNFNQQNPGGMMNMQRRNFPNNPQMNRRPPNQNLQNMNNQMGMNRRRIPSAQQMNQPHRQPPINRQMQNKLP